MSERGDRAHPPPATPERHRCRIVDNDGTTVADFVVAPTRPVLHQMQMVGISALTVGCRGGGCGACRVEIVDGRADFRPMSARHVSDDDRRAGLALACCAIPTDDLVLRPDPSPNYRGPGGRRTARTNTGANAGTGTNGIGQRSPQHTATSPTTTSPTTTSPTATSPTTTSPTTTSPTTTSPGGSLPWP